MEVDVFWAMNGYLGYATVFSFLCRFVRAGRAPKRVVQVACYVADRSLYEFSLLQYLPSEVAAACVFIARASCHLDLPDKYTALKLKFLGSQSPLIDARRRCLECFSCCF